MTRRLILTRHAKSSWDDSNLDDHDRPLNKRGRRAATAIGAWIADHNCAPDEVIVSSAARTCETWALIAAALKTPPEPRITRALYLAEPDEMLETLRGAQGETVMMIAHNPGTAFLAAGLLASPPSDGRFQHYPSGATTLIEFDTENWADLGWHQGAARAFVVPRDLVG